MSRISPRSRRILCVFTLALAFLGWRAEATASTAGYLRAQGSHVGAIHGDVARKDQLNTIAVLSIAHRIVVPSSGPRQAQALVLTLLADRSLPILMQSAANNEVLTTFEVSMFAPDKMGVEKRAYRIMLVNARIKEYRLSWDIVRADAPQDHRDYVQLEVAYERLILTWDKGGITAEDSPFPSIEGVGAPAPSPKPKAAPAKATAPKRRRAR